MWLLQPQRDTLGSSLTCFYYRFIESALRQKSWLVTSRLPSSRGRQRSFVRQRMYSRLPRHSFAEGTISSGGGTAGWLRRCAADKRVVAVCALLAAAVLAALCFTWLHDSREMPAGNEMHPCIRPGAQTHLGGGALTATRRPSPPAAICGALSDTVLSSTPPVQPR